jgi:hypothetical protein
MKRRLVAFLLATAMVATPILPARAQFGFGGVVFDPSSRR